MASPTPSAGGFLKRTFAALKFRDFRNLMIGNGISNIGSWMQLVAQPWLVLTLSGSSFLVGLDGFAGHLPSFLFLIPGGILADRRNRKQIMIISQIVQLASAALIAFLLVAGKTEVWMIIALSFCVGTAQSFSFPAYQAMVTTLIPKEHLGNAISLNSMQFNVSRVIGPLLAGVTMASLGAAWCFGLNAFSFLALLIALYSMHTSVTANRPVDPSKPRETIRAGFQVILHNPRILGILLLVACSTAFCGPLSTFLPVLIKNAYGGGASAFSFSIAIFGVGALIGAFGIAAQSARLNEGVAVWSCLALAVLVMLVALAHRLWMVDSLLLFSGAAMVTSTAAANTFLQSLLSNEYRARVASLFLLAIRGGFAFGNLLTGAAIDRLGVHGALGADGLLALVLTLWVWHKYLRRPGLTATT